MVASALPVTRWPMSCPKTTTRPPTLPCRPHQPPPPPSQSPRRSLLPAIWRCLSPLSPHRPTSPASAEPVSKPTSISAVTANIRMSGELRHLTEVCRRWCGRRPEVARCKWWMLKAAVVGGESEAGGGTGGVGGSAEGQHDARRGAGAGAEGQRGMYTEVGGGTRWCRWCGRLRGARRGG